MVVGGNRKGRTIKQNSCVHVTKSSHLWKVCRKPRESSHLRKVENGEIIRKRLCTCCVGAVAQFHLRKVCRKPREPSHLRKVGNGKNIRKRLCTCCVGTVAQFHLRKVCRKPRESSHLRKVGNGENIRKRLCTCCVGAVAQSNSTFGRCAENSRIVSPSEGGKEGRWDSGRGGRLSAP